MWVLAFLDRVRGIPCIEHRRHVWEDAPCTTHPVVLYVGACRRMVCSRCGAESHHYPSER